MGSYTKNGTPHYHSDRDCYSSAILAALEQASEYRRAVFPLRGKHPAITTCPKTKGKQLTGEERAEHARTCPHVGHGVYDATTDRSRIHALFNSAPDATGYGIACGAASGIVVVDVDGPEGRREAEALGLRSGYVVKSGREDGDGWHIYLSIPPGVQGKSRDLAPDVELKADGSYVVGPGSVHRSGRTYRVAKDGEPSPAPEWIMQPEPANATSRPRSPGQSEASSPATTGPVSIDTAGPGIPDGERNRTLTRVAGRLHDGTRDLDQLTRDLGAINGARCTPPLGSAEVAKIAASIYGRTPCRPGPAKASPVSERVRQMAARLRAIERPIRGRGGASGWAICHAGLELALSHGREHPEGFTVTVDSRTWAQMAGTENSTVTRWWNRSPLVEVLERGKGRRASTILFRVPDGGGAKGCYTQHSSTGGDSQENEPDRSDAYDTLLRTLYRTRWTERPRKRRQGVARGSRRVRQGVTPAREGRGRMGKSRAALLDLIRRHPGAPRRELARLKGVKPASLTHPLRWLVEAGLIVRTGEAGRGCYEAADALAGRVEDAREMAGEPEADRLQIARHARERQAYRERDRIKADRAPSESEMDRDPRRAEREKRLRVDVLVARGMARRFAEREVFGSEVSAGETYRVETSPDLPHKLRRAHIATAMARLFVDRPEYRTRRAGQIVCKLPDYLAPDFPRGPDSLGLPKDHEVEELLDGVAA